MKGVVRDISTPCPALLSKFAAALPLIPVNVGTQAAAVAATFEKLDNVPQATFPFESVTAGATNTLAVEYTQNPVGEFIVTPPVTIGSDPANISVFWGIA